MSLPMSLRKRESEIAYQEAKKAGDTVPLELEPSLRMWRHWRLIDNRFPYDSAFVTHHMLVPNRGGVANRWDLNAVEKAEFESILHGFVYPTYDLWFENTPHRRSVATLYHVHLGKYKEAHSE